MDCAGAAEGFDGLFGGLVGIVALECRLVGWFCFRCLQRRGGEVLNYLDEEDVGASFSKGNGHCLTDASRAAGHEGDLALEGEEFLNGCHGGDCCW